MTNISTENDNFQPSLSVAIYTYNSQDDIQGCIDSALYLSDKIYIIDFESTDNTKDILKKNKVTLYEFPHIDYVEPARNFGMEKAKTDWVFILDADERITKELAEEVKLAIHSPEYSYYRVPRKELFLKKIWLKHGGWWPNGQIRLINKNHFKLWPKEIHSTPIVEGKSKNLTNAMLHFSKNDYEKIVNKTINFEDKESELLFNANKPVNTLTFFRKFLGELYRRMFKWHGYKDGTIGIIESIYQAFSKTITYLYLYEKKNSRSL